MRADTHCSLSSALPAKMTSMRRICRAPMSEIGAAGTKVNGGQLNGGGQAKCQARSHASARGNTKSTDCQSGTGITCLRQAQRTSDSRNRCNRLRRRCGRTGRIEASPKRISLRASDAAMWKQFSNRSWRNWRRSLMHRAESTASDRQPHALVTSTEAPNADHANSKEHGRAEGYRQERTLAA